MRKRVGKYFSDTHKIKKQKEEILKELFSSDSVSIKELREFATSPFGLINKELRKKSWPVLLNIDKTCTNITARIIDDHADAKQVDKDVVRSLSHFSSFSDLSEDAARKLRKKLKLMIMELLHRNDFQYYQGFNDICSVFLLVMGKRLGTCAAEIVSRFLIRDFLFDSFDKGVKPMLLILDNLISKISPELHPHFQKLGLPSFILPWLLTWFAHCTDSLDIASRIFDCCIGNSEPLMPVYLSASLIYFAEEAIPPLEVDAEPDDILMAIREGVEKVTLTEGTVEELIHHAQNMLKLYPKETLLNNVSPYFDPSSPLVSQNLTLDYYISAYSLYRFEKAAHRIHSQHGTILDRVKGAFWSFLNSGADLITNIYTSL